MQHQTRPTSVMHLIDTGWPPPLLLVTVMMTQATASFSAKSLCCSIANSKTKSKQGGSGGVLPWLLAAIEGEPESLGAFAMKECRHNLNRGALPSQPLNVHVAFEWKVLARGCCNGNIDTIPAQVLSVSPGAEKEKAQTCSSSPSTDGTLVSFWSYLIMADLSV